jgi:peptidoglycan/xylan/chitin deacetylase (PgdA/CDA1 family)
VAALGVSIALVGIVRAARTPAAGAVHVFAGLAGPSQPSPVPLPVPADWRRFASGGTSRLAILLTDPDSAWLGLVHGLRSLGVPFLVTDDPRRALRHRVVLVYPRISGRSFAPEALRALAEFARGGGTLVAVNVLGGGLEPLFGFSGVAARRDHTRVRFDPGQPLLADWDDPREAEIRIASLARAATRIGSHDYLAPTSPPLAVYEDGAAAIVQREFTSGGRACAIGFDPGLLLLKAHNRRLEGVSDAYANAFDPSADMPLRLLARLYRAGEPLAVTAEPVPEGRRLAALITHDVDYSRSLANSVTYAEALREAGVAGTFFVQTKYVRDWNDEAFFDDRGAAHLARLAELGMEIASHSVSHSRVFDDFPLGSGSERYPDYRPFVKSRDRTFGGTILGELRVSRFLLERLGSTRVASFRPGHLANPRTLPQALAATGYSFSSSVTSNVSLSHLPFRLTWNRDAEAESEVFEFPVTLEDELEPPLPQRLDAAVALARRIARRGGIFVVLLHPNALGEKLDFEQRLVAALAELAWIAPLGEYGRWWAARDRLEIDVVATPSGGALELRAPQSIAGLTLRLPRGWRLEGAEPVVPGGDLWRLAPLEGRIRLGLRRERA